MMTSLPDRILDQLARSTLLPTAMSEDMFAGKAVDRQEIIMALIHGAMDCHAMTAGASTATWTDRRLARQVLTIAFLLAIADLEKSNEH